MPFCRLQAILVAILLATSISVGISFIRPSAFIAIFSACFALAAVFFARRQPSAGNGCTKSEVISALKNRATTFWASAETHSVEANLHSAELQELADNLHEHSRGERNAVEVLERLLTDLDSLRETMASTGKCLVDSRMDATVGGPLLKHHQRPFSNTFARSSGRRDASRLSDQNSEPDLRDKPSTETALKHLSDGYRLVESLSQTVNEFRLERLCLARSTEDLVEAVNSRKAASQTIAFAAERMVSVFREVDYVLGLALQNRPLVPARLVAGSRIENGHPESGKHCTLKTLPTGELDRTQLVEIR